VKLYGRALGCVAVFSRQGDPLLRMHRVALWRGCQ